MSDLPDQWGAYRCLQEKLLDKDRLDAEAWGLEAALNAIVESVATDVTLTQDEIERSVATTARGERYRAHLRLVYLQSDEPADDGAVVRAIEAREIVFQVAEIIASNDLDLLRGIAEGYDYKDLASQHGVTPGSLRVKVMRLRASLMHHAA